MTLFQSTLARMYHRRHRWCWRGTWQSGMDRSSRAVVTFTRLTRSDEEGAGFISRREKKSLRLPPAHVLEKPPAGKFLTRSRFVVNVKSCMCVQLSLTFPPPACRLGPHNYRESNPPVLSPAIEPATTLRSLWGREVTWLHGSATGETTWRHLLLQNLEFVPFFERKLPVVGRVELVLSHKHVIVWTHKGDRRQRRNSHFGFVSRYVPASESWKMFNWYDADTLSTEEDQGLM